MWAGDGHLMWVPYGSPMWAPFKLLQVHKSKKGGCCSCVFWTPSISNSYMMPYGVNVGWPIWVPCGGRVGLIWGLRGLAHMGPMCHPLLFPCGAHMEEVGGGHVGPIWEPCGHVCWDMNISFTTKCWYLTRHLSGLDAGSMWADWAPTNWAHPSGAHVGPKWANPSQHAHVGPTWAVDGHGGLGGPWARDGQICGLHVGPTWAAHIFFGRHNA